MSQAKNGLTAIPAPNANEAVIYLPQIFHMGGAYIPELTLADCSRDGVINDIASGQHEGTIKVIAVDIAAGKCWDVSKEIAKGVVAQLLDIHGYVPYEQLGFIEDHLGIRYLAAYRHEAA